MGTEKSLEIARCYLQLEQVRPLLVNVGSLGLEDPVQALHLERGSGDGEVDDGDSGANVRRELDGGISGRQENGEGRRQVDVLVAQGDQHPTSGPLQLTVQHRIQYRIVILHILKSIICTTSSV